MHKKINLKRIASSILVLIILVSSVWISSGLVMAASKKLTQDYESYEVKTYASDNTDGIQGTNDCREVSSAVNYTTGGSKSAKIALASADAMTVNNAFKKYTFVPNAGGVFIRPKQGTAVKVSFWAYLDVTSEKTVQDSKTIRIMLGSANSERVSAGAISQLESTSLNSGNASILEQATTISKNTWTKVTLSVSSFAGNENWDDAYLTMHFCEYNYAASLYIDDLSVEYEEAPAKVSPIKTCTIDYESIDAKKYAADNTDGVLGTEPCREVSAEQNNTINGGKSAKIAIKSANAVAKGFSDYTLAVGEAGEYIQPKQGKAVTVSFWAYLDVTAENTVQASKTIRMMLGSANSLQFGNGAITQLEATSLNNNTASRTEQATTLIKNTWTKITLSIANFAGNANWIDTYLTMHFCAFNYSGSLYIDDLTVVYEQAPAKKQTLVNKTQDYELFDAKTFAKDNTDGIQGTDTGREVSSAFNSTANGSKSLKLTLPNAGSTDIPNALKKNVTVLNFDGESFKAVGLRKYTVSFKAYLKPDDSTKTGTKFIRFALGSANSAKLADGAEYQVESTSVDGGAVSSTNDVGKTLTIGAWTDVRLEVPSLAGKAGWTDTYLTLSACIYSYSASLYIDDVTITYNDIVIDATVNGYEQYDAKVYAANNTTGIQGSDNCREVSTDQNHTEGGTRSAKVKLDNANGLTVANAFKKHTMVLNDGVNHIKVKEGTDYTVTFWVYLAVTSESTAQDLKTIRMMLGTADSPQISNGARTMLQRTSLNGATSSALEQSVQLAKNTWTQVTMDISEISSGYAENYLTLQFCAYNYSASLYIDDVNVVVKQETFDDYNYSSVQEYEAFEAKTFDATEANGIHGIVQGRTVSTEANHTAGGSKSIKLRMNNTELDAYAQTVVNLDGKDVQWRKNTSYVISFWVMFKESNSVTLRLASAGGGLSWIPSPHTIEEEQRVALTSNVWTQVSFKVNRATGLSGNRYMTIGATFDGAGTEVSIPEDGFKLTKYLYIDDVTITPVGNMPKVVFNTGVDGLSVPKLNAFIGEPMDSLPNITRDGWLFTGWYSQDGSVRYDNSSIMPNTDSLNVYAKWVQAPTTAYSFQSGFEQSEYNTGVNPYENNGSAANVDGPIMTATAVWLTDAGFKAETGDCSISLVNSSPYVDQRGSRYQAAALVNPDGTPFVAIKGQKYRISYSYMGDVARSANSYVAAVVSNLTAMYGVGAQGQVLTKNHISAVTDWNKSDEFFEANQTGYVYLTLFARGNTLQMNSDGHTAYFDNVSVELVDSSYVTVNFVNGTSVVSSQIGKIGQPLDMPRSPTAAGSIFNGWYTDEECTQKYNSWNFPSADSTLYAGFRAADYSGASSDISSIINFSFEETEMLRTWLWDPAHMEWSENSMQFVFDDPQNARTGNNYIKWNAVDNHWTNRYLMLYDANSKNNVLYLEPNTTYMISYWYKVPDDYMGVQFDLRFCDPSDAQLDQVKVDTYSLIAEKLEVNKWTEVKHCVTTGEKQVAAVITTYQAQFDVSIDDVSVQKVVDVEVSYDTNGGSEMDNTNALTGYVLDKPSDPVKDGYKFLGWYADENLKIPFDFDNTIITKATKLYAKWDVDTEVASQDEEVKYITEVVYEYEISHIALPDISAGDRPILTDADAVKKSTKKDVVTKKTDSTSDFPWWIVFTASGVVVAGVVATVIIVLINKRKKGIKQGGR